MTAAAEAVEGQRRSQTETNQQRCCLKVPPQLKVTPQLKVPPQ